MLKTPPGINKREGSSKYIEDAGAVFDSLYKKYLNTENIQKQAETYLLKSLYNKTVSKKKAPAPESGDSTSGLADTSRPSAQTPKGAVGSNISKLVDYYQNLPQHAKGSGAEHSKSTPAKLNQKVSFEDQQPPRPLASFNSAIGSVTGTSARGLNGTTSNSPLAAHVSSLTNGSVSDDLSDVSDDVQLNRNYIRIQKVQDDQNSDSPELNRVSKNGRDSKEDPLEGIEDYFSSPPTSKRYSRYFYNISAKRKDSLYVSTVCILVQSLLFVFLLTGFLLLNTYIINLPLRNCFVNVSFPFLIHFLLFYAVFNYADDYLRKKQLMYTNDFNLDVVTRRLNREIAFTNLSRVTFWFDKAVIVLAVVIACFPFSGTYNLKLWTYTEYVYMVLVFVFFILHVLYSLYYFNFKFIELVFSKRSSRSDNYSASNDASGDVSNTDAGVPNTAADDYSIVDGVEVERMELKKRLYKSYKSRKLSNPSTKSRRRHTQSNR
ncbi:conserved hypothetical protein [Theileria orientalis strain Shintoku]|uniref:Uncharacterized protein n=1 Tax=Theileria orientalis strain Shintoku TaxID=869250 RepID=J4CDQ7_THEOR|nr:conserved hypothetical protein [Theileria orientalis strain Shintoku]BAM41562.1 conserved hypothetical protein [Theileria orientalis strain Shintoku]|eukprot:XP_009691863.1 conserved hypothetical protein [Theileria orientalis strain Shintoku]